MMDKLKKGKYNWIGHTHLGCNPYCLYPSDADKNVLMALNQTDSMIYNELGQHIRFDIDGIYGIYRVDWVIALFLLWFFL